MRYPGTKTITGYMKAEYVKFAILIVTAFQLGSIYALCYHADKLFTLVHVNLSFGGEDPLYVD